MVVPPLSGLIWSDMQETGKTALRTQYRQKRDGFVAAMNPSELAIAFSKAPTPLKQLFTPGKIVAGYIPIGSEANPAALLAEAQAMGCNLALPYVVSRAAPMRFLRWLIGDALEDGPFGLKQPRADSDHVNPDVLLVPLVAFDRRMFRLGQGAGHYDRALSVLPRAAPIGIAWSVQEADHVPADPWDMPLDAIITERAWIAP
jgi:5-formyltetrahydrofolate cyclo-ligase